MHTKKQEKVIHQIVIIIISQPKENHRRVSISSKQAYSSTGVVFYAVYIFGLR